MPSNAAIAASNAFAAYVTTPNDTTHAAMTAALDASLPAVAERVGTLTDNTVALFTTEADGGIDGQGTVTIRGADGVGVGVPSYRKLIDMALEVRDLDDGAWTATPDITTDDGAWS